MIKLIIADNHPVMIYGIIESLKTEPNVKILDTAITGMELLNKLKKNAPDIVILETNIPDIPGIDLAKTIQTEYKNVKVLFLTQFDDKWLIKRSIEVGAIAYLIKNITKEELIFSINKVAEGDVGFFYKKGSQ